MMGSWQNPFVNPLRLILFSSVWLLTDGPFPLWPGIRSNSGTKLPSLTASIRSVGSTPSAAVTHWTTTLFWYLNDAFCVFHQPPPHLYCKWSYTSGFPKPAILSWGSCEGCVFLAGICGLPDICWFPYPNRHPRSRFCTRCPERTDMDPGTQAALNEQEGREVKGFRGVALSLNCREKQMHKLFPWPLLAEDRPLLEQGQFFSIERGDSSVGTVRPHRLQQESLWCTWALIFSCLYFLTANEL